MKNLILCLTLVGLCTSVGFANDEKEKGDHRSVTGCLMKGDSPDKFTLKGTDGSTWDVSSKQVALAKHVGHTVTVTGAVANAKMHNMKEDAKDAAKDAGMMKDSSEHGSLKATGVEMVSDSCQ